MKIPTQQYNMGLDLAWTDVFDTNTNGCVLGIDDARPGIPAL